MINPIRTIVVFLVALATPLLSGQSSVPSIATAPTDEKSSPLTLPSEAELKDPNTLISLAAKANGLHDGSLTPWHLKATYETFDGAGQSTGQGVFEEWWLAPDKWKRSYVGAHFSQVEYRTPESDWFETAAGPTPWPESLIAQQLIDPMPDYQETQDSVAELREQQFGKIKLSCVMFSQPLHHTKWPLGLFPTYCFNQASVILRFGLFDGSIQALLNKIAKFQGHYVSEEIALSDDTKPLLRIHLESLRSMAAKEAEIPEPPPGTPEAKSGKVTIASAVMAGHKVQGPNPQYPVEAKENRIEGTVVLQAVIGTDGRIHRLHVLSSPDDYLSVASVAAVERWVYTPYLLVGKPVIVETTVKVIYHLGG